MIRFVSVLLTSKLLTAENEAVFYCSIQSSSCSLFFVKFTELSSCFVNRKNTKNSIWYWLYMYSLVQTTDCYNALTFRKMYYNRIVVHVTKCQCMYFNFKARNRIPEISIGVFWMYYFRYKFQSSNFHVLQFFSTFPVFPLFQFFLLFQFSTFIICVKFASKTNNFRD